MDPSDLRDLLTVLRDMGATSARFEAGELAEVHLAPFQSRGEFPSTATDVAEDEDLPPGAFDPIKRRKKAQGAPPRADEGDDS